MSLHAAVTRTIVAGFVRGHPRGHPVAEPSCITWLSRSYSQVAGSVTGDSARRAELSSWLSGLVARAQNQLSHEPKIILP